MHEGSPCHIILTQQEHPPTAIKVIYIYDKLDHYAESFTLQMANPPLPRKEIIYRRYKARDIEAFSLDIQQSRLFSLEAEDVDVLAEIYNQFSQKSLTHMLH